MDQVIDQKVDVAVIDGLIVIDAKPGLAATLTPGVAQELAEELGAAVVIAYAQKPLPG